MRKVLKVFLIVLGILVLFILIITISAFISSSFRKPNFVNETLSFQNPLFIPTLLEPTIQNGKKVFDLTLKEGSQEFFKGKQTKTWGINGNYLGPTLHMQTEDNVEVHVANTLSETTTIHWHGMELPAIMDGGPHQTIEPNTTWKPTWTIKNQASTLWYHPHIMGKTGPQVYKGLSGMIIIDDKNSNAVSIPKEYGVDDIPLIIQDKKFDSNGQFVYDHNHMNMMSEITSGMLGDAILVNGTFAPFVNIPTKIVRLRLLNASNARSYNFGFSDDHVFYQIATDGGFLEAPVQKNRIELASGERAEILVDMTDIHNPITLMSFPLTPDENKVRGFMLGLIVGKTDENEQFKIIELRPKVTLKESTQIPPKLNEIKRLQRSDAVKTRLIKLNTASINGKKMDMGRIDEMIKKGDIEIWQVRNDSPTDHPFHIHGIQFQIVSRDGQEPKGSELGWKDTVFVAPGKSVELIMQFNEFTDPKFPYMYHCHILEHEDMGMMGQFVVIDENDTVEENRTIPKSMNMQSH